MLNFNNNLFTNIVIHGLLNVIIHVFLITLIIIYVELTYHF